MRIYETIKNIIIYIIPWVFGASVLSNADSYSYKSKILYIIAIPACSILMYLARRYLSAQTWANLSNFILAITMALYCAEGFITYKTLLPSLGFRQTNFPHTLATNGLPYDKRSKLEVVADTQARYPTERVIPQLSPEPVLDYGLTQGSTIVPLSGPSSRYVITCNEAGYWGYFKSDRYGFNNPDTMWDQHPQIAVLGSSHTQGLCLLPGEGWVDHFKKRYPNTLNLGQSNSGALYQLAILKEYLTSIRPKIIVWVFFDGFDNEALSLEMRNSVFQHYLREKDFSQNLSERQPDIDKIELSFIDKIKNSLLLRYRLSEQEIKLNLYKFPTLQHLRERLKQIKGAPTPPPPPQSEETADYPELRQVLLAAKETAAAWGGHIHLVYLPTVASSANHRPGLHHSAALAIAHELGLGLTDLYQTFDALPDPTSVHPYGETSHLTSDGSAIMANAIIKDLER